MLDKIALSIDLLSEEFKPLLEIIPLPEILRSEIETIVFSIHNMSGKDHRALDRILYSAIQWLIESKIREWHMKALEQGYLTIVAEQEGQPVWAMRVEDGEIRLIQSPTDRQKMANHFESMVDYVMEQIGARMRLQSTQPLDPAGILN